MKAATAWCVQPVARLGTVALAIALWWFFTGVLGASNPVIGRMTPQAAFSALFDLLGDPTTLTAIAASLRRLLVGLTIALIIGAPVGYLVGSSALAEYASAPVIQFLRMTSPLAWAPLVIVVLGTDDAPVIALISLAAVWPIVIGIASATRALDPGAGLVAKSLGATRWEVIRSTVLPGLARPLRTSLRIALGVAWIVIVPAEMFGVSTGLGYLILNARDNLNYEALAATMVLIGAIGFLLDRILRGPAGDARGGTG